MTTTTLRSDDELTVTEAARRLRRHPQTVREYIHSGQLPAHRLGAREFRINASDLELLISPTQPPKEGDVEDAPVESLEALAIRLVSTWPRLSDERKRELGALLATP